MMCGYFKFFSGGKFFAAAVLCVLLGMTATFAEANDITGIKASQTKDSTRIIIETEDAPKYSYSVSQDGTEYTVRIMNIGNPKKKYGMATITSGSILKSVKRGSGKQEVFYVFGLKKPVTPTFNSYRNSSGSGAKLVMEFPHNQTEADRKKLLPVKPAGATAVTRTDSNKSEGQNRKTNPQTVNRPESENLNSLVATAPNAGKSAQKSDMEVLEDALFDTLNEASDNDDPSESVEKRLSNPEPPKPVHNARKNKNTCVVVIDPGHGGKDPGAIGKNGTYEKNVTLGISKYLLEYINGDKTLTGYLTRSNDKFIALGDRSKIARTRKADMLISIHADSAANSEANGASVLVLSKDRADRENDKITARDQTKLIGGAGDAINHMCGENKYLKDCSFVVDLASSSSMNYGFELANKLLGRLKMITRLHKKTPISRSLAVLKAPDIPSLLIETGYLSNNDEERLLATDKYRRRIAYGIYLGIKDFVEANPSVCVNTASSVSSSAPSKTSGSAGRTSGSKASVVHVVKKGENLTVIAKKYGVSVASLKKLNNLRTGQVNVGQRLRIK